ncbi:MAG: exodeoxyribonuclease I [Candidatus Saccharibacteria bacterium]
MNEPTFLFYDLETTGLNPRTDRIMQFAAQRTNLALEPIGEPFNLIVALTDEVLPNPFAILTTGITPQQSRRDGMTEADFVKIVQTQAFTAGTIAIGFNTVRFDDEFMRHSFYRNFFDPYEYTWSNGRSRWDLLDIIRMTRALRPEGIEWPVKEDGTPVNKLELITKANNISHERAHDALSDVIASIDVARLLYKKQPDLFNFLLKLRDKKEVAKIVDHHNPKPFVYSSGKFGSKYDFTSVCVPISEPDSEGRVVVYDLRYDPSDYEDMSADDLRGVMFAKYEARQVEGFKPFPGKRLAFNKCPAVAPLGVLRHDDQERIQLDIETIERHLAALQNTAVKKNMIEALKRDKVYPSNPDVDGALYDGFFGPGDKAAIETVRNATPLSISKLSPRFSDARLPELFLRYKARNMPDALSETEAAQWESYRAERIASDMPAFVKAMEQASVGANPRDLSLLEDLQLWAQSIIPDID